MVSRGVPRASGSAHNSLLYIVFTFAVTCNKAAQIRKRLDLLDLLPVDALLYIESPKSATIIVADFGDYSRRLQSPSVDEALDIRHQTRVARAVCNNETPANV